MKKKILISLFTVGVLSSTAFAKAEQVGQQDDVYSYVLQGIAQTQKDFLGISAIHNEPNGLVLQNLKASQGKTQQPILLNQLSFFNPSSNGMQIGVKNINLQQMVVSKATAYELPELPAQLTSTSSDISSILTQAVRRAKAEVASSPFQLATDSAKLDDLSNRDTADSPIQFIANSSKVDDLSDGEIRGIKTPGDDSAIQLTDDSSNVADFFDQSTRNIQSQLDSSSLQLTADFSEVGDYSSWDAGTVHLQFIGSTMQLTAGSFEEGNLVEQRKVDAPIQVTSSTSRPSMPPPPPVFSAKAANLGQVKKGAGFDFGNVIEQLKAQMNGSGLLSTSTVSQSKNDKGPEISLGQMGTISGKEAQKFADRWAKLKEAAEASSSAPVSGKGDSSSKKVDVTTPKVTVAKKPVNFRARALSLQKKVANPISSGSADQLKQAKLNKAVVNEDKYSVLPLSLPAVAKSPSLQEKDQVVQLGGFYFNATMIDSFKQEATNEVDDNDSEWDDEDDTPVAVAKTITPVVLKPEVEEEVIAKTVTPKVGRLSIKTNSGGDWLAQIKAARTRIEAVEVDQVKIQTVLDAENIRARKKEQEERERELQERQIAKLNLKKENSNDDLGSALIGALTKRAAAIHGNDEDDAW